MDVISVPTSEATKKKISFEDYLLMPEVNYPYEIIDGELMPSPAPIPVHQRIVANTFVPLSNYVEAKDLGVVLFAPVDIIPPTPSIAYPSTRCVVYSQRQALRDRF